MSGRDREQSALKKPVNVGLADQACEPQHAGLIPDEMAAWAWWSIFAVRNIKSGLI